MYKNKIRESYIFMLRDTGRITDDKAYADRLAEKLHSRGASSRVDTVELKGTETGRLLGYGIRSPWEGLLILSKIEKL